MLLLPLIGYGWSAWDRAPAAPWLPATVVGVGGVDGVANQDAMAQRGGTDRDQGEVLLGRAVAVPRGTVPCSYLALAVAVALAFVATLVAGWAALICAVLAVLYSHPYTVWKGRPLLGPLVNGVGYGLLSTLAGWAVVEVAPAARTVLVWLFSGSAILGCYFAAQAFQGDEDRARGYRTLVVTHGARGALLAGRICIGVGLLGGTILAALGWLPRLCLVALPLALWIDGWLRRWSALPDGGNERWALTWRGVCSWRDWCALRLAYVDYGLEWWTGA